MRVAKWAAVTVMAVMLGAAGCSSGEGDGGDAKAPASPRPQGTGQLTKGIVRADLDTSVADAGVLANAPEYAQNFERAPTGSQPSCTVAFKGFGTDTNPVDLARFEVLVGELRERAWQQPGDRKERKDRDGVIGVAEVVLKQRGWRMVAEYRSIPEEGVITLMAFDEACMKRYGTNNGPVS